MNSLLPEVQVFVTGLALSTIPAARQSLLQKLSDYIQRKLENDDEGVLNFICTHNSRRSQLCQVWAYTAAFYFGVDKIRVCSGGTEVMAFHPNAIRALTNAGLLVTRTEDKINPVYSILCSRDADPVPCFSKLYNDPFNSTAPFIAVMTCSDAEAHCPFIPEAEEQFSIKYKDPKRADGTSLEAQAYDERNRQIATEMFYIFSKIKV